jgi:hypothetical protein
VFCQVPNLSQTEAYTVHCSTLQYSHWGQSPNLGTSQRAKGSGGCSEGLRRYTCVPQFLRSGVLPSLFPANTPSQPGPDPRSVT